MGIQNTDIAHTLGTGAIQSVLNLRTTHGKLTGQELALTQKDHAVKTARQPQLLIFQRQKQGINILGS